MTPEKEKEEAEYRWKVACDAYSKTIDNKEAISSHSGWLMFLTIVEFSRRVC